MASHFAAVHMQKFKIGAVKGIQFHNQRERNSKTNKDIDPTKTEENYDLKNENKINYVRRVDEIIKNNVQTDRAIRKDAVVMCNFVVSSDKEFFEQMDEKATKSFFKESYEFFKEKYGEENIVAC
ncbi:MAG: MobV family relaxase, partial [Sarcina sp.]